MDQKSWLWRKKSSEKLIVANEDEVQSMPNQKELDLENNLKCLNQKLASVLDDCSAKDKLIQEHEKRAENASADKLTAENEAQCLKLELEEARKQNAASNERLGHLNSALKDCMGQLNLAREEEFEKTHKMLEEKLSEASKSLESQTCENSYLTKALIMKGKLIDDLSYTKCQKEAEFEALMTRLDLTEKENAFLRYEFRALESELEARNEEMEYSRRSAEARQKQNSENIKKLKKLEAECHRLRNSTRRQIPGPIVNIKNDVRPQPGRNQMSTRRMGAAQPENSLIDLMRDLENENKILKECLARKEDEIIYHKKAKNFSDGLSLASSRSWATTAQASEHEHDKFPDGPQTEPECQTIGSCPEMSLMDDFVEMEKLAIVKVSDSLNETESHDWIQDIKAIILKLLNASTCKVDEILEEIRMALEDEAQPVKPQPGPISGYITWKSPILSPKPSPFEDHPTVIDKFRKHLGGPGPGTALELDSVQNLMHEMEKMHSVLQDEMMESKRTYEEEIEHLKMANLDLDTQLTVAKSEVGDLQRKLASVVVELENKSQFCEELEGTCVELQLRLESVTINQCSKENGNKEDLLETGMEITKASDKLAECEQTIMKLGQQLKALGPPNQPSPFNTKKTTLKQRSSLRDQMISEENQESNYPPSPKTKEIISTTANGSAPPVGCYGAFSFPDGQVASNYGSKNGGNMGALVVAPAKRRLGFLRKLLLRRKRHYAGKNDVRVW